MSFIKSKTSRAVFVFIDLAVIALVFTCTFTDAFTADRALWNTGLRRLVFYTVESNLLAAAALLAALPFKLKRWRDGSELPFFCTLLTFAGVTSTTITFMTVICFLGPTMGYGTMYVGNSFFLHLVCPVLAALSFVFDAQSEKKLKMPHIAVSLIPTAVYGVVYFIMVVVIGKQNGGWDDFYGFNRGGLWYVSYIVMLGAAFLIGALLRLAHNAVEKRIG